METNSNPIHNLLTNLDRNKKIALVLGIVIIVVLLGFILLSIPKNQSDDNNPGTQTTDDQDTPISTEYNKDHEYTLTDYLPMSDVDYVKDTDGDYNVVEYWSISENTAVEKGIVITVDSCNVEENTAAAKEYLESTTINLSEYSIVYQTSISEIPCDQL